MPKLLTQATKKHYAFTSAEEIRARVLEVCERNKNLITNASANRAGLQKDAVTSLSLDANKRKISIENWIQRLIYDAAQRYLLMSKQQLKDWREDRVFTVGDKARYIGETRDEHVSIDATVTRHTGQTGIIISVEPSQDKLYEVNQFVFRPDKAGLVHGTEDTIFVDLEVTELTPAWLTLERVVETPL